LQTHLAEYSLLPTKTKPIFRLLAAACLVFSQFFFLGCGSRPLASITVGVPPLEQNALLYIAAEKRFFKRNGITVAIKDFPSGPAAIAATVSGLADIAETAEFPFVVAVMRGQQLRILAINDRFENDYLVGREDRGITTIPSLKGKRIGVTFGTITDFYLDRFLLLNGISSNQVAKVDVPPSAFVQSLLDGSVDAVVAWQPFVAEMLSQKRNAFAVWTVQSSQPVFGMVVCEGSWLSGHGKLAVAFLRSLAQAEEFLNSHPREARTIVAKTLNYSMDYMTGVWPQHEFSLTLGFSVIAAMEDEASWLVEKKLADQKQIPDFAGLIYRDGLNVVSRQSVNLMQ